MTETGKFNAIEAAQAHLNRIPEYKGVDILDGRLPCNTEKALRDVQRAKDVMNLLSSLRYIPIEELYKTLFGKDLGDYANPDRTLRQYINPEINRLHIIDELTHIEESQEEQPVLQLSELGRHYLALYSDGRLTPAKVEVEGQNSTNIPPQTLDSPNIYDLLMNITQENMIILNEPEDIIGIIQETNRKPRTDNLNEAIGNVLLQLSREGEVRYLLKELYEVMNQRTLLLVVPTRYKLRLSSIRSTDVKIERYAYPNQFITALPFHVLPKHLPYVTTVLIPLLNT